jgi:hypothetical protein
VKQQEQALVGFQMGAIARHSIAETDNLGSGGNTSSIMLCNDTSIIRREGAAATFG